MNENLTYEMRNSLLLRHKTERDGRIKDRIKAVLLLDDGWTYSAIAKALFISEDSVLRHISDYKKSEKLKPQNGGSDAKLDVAQCRELLAYLEEKTYLYVKEIVAYVFEKYKLKYCISGMTAWLHAHNFSYHKPAVTPAKADKKRQEDFIKFYENLKKTLPENEDILFMDGVHPTHEVRVVSGWIRKGNRKEIATNGRSKRLNILGVLNLEKMEVITQECDTINAIEIKRFFDGLQEKMPTSSAIHIVLDCAGYQKCAEIEEYLLKNNRIKLHYLPPYSPNLNAIERLWKIMHQHTTYNKYYSKFKDFTKAIREFFAETFPKKAKSLVDTLTDNFRAVQSPIFTAS